MNESTAEFRETPVREVELRVTWIVAVAIVVATFAAELLPVLFGTGERAVWDWTFVYITLRFVLLPVISLVDLLIVVPICYRRARGRGAAVKRAILASGLIPLLFVLASYFYPIPWLP